MIANHWQYGRIAEDPMQGRKCTRYGVRIVRKARRPDGMVDNVTGIVDIVDFLYTRMTLCIRAITYLL